MTTASDLDERRALAGRDIPAAIHRLDSLDNPVSRAVLDLHQRAADGRQWTCNGDEFGGYEAEPPVWPCDTVHAIAAIHGIDLTDAWLFRRPVDGSLDTTTG